MNKTLELAQAFKTTSEKELKRIEQTTQNAIEQHTKNLLKQLKDAEQTTLNAIQTEQNNYTKYLREQYSAITKTTLRAYKIPLYCLFSVMITMAVVSLYLSWQAKTSYTQMKMWQKSAQIAKDLTNGIMVSTCGEGNHARPCVAVFSQGDWTTKEDKEKGIVWKIIAPQE